VAGATASGGRDDGAQDEGHLPVEAYHGVGHHRHGDRGGDHETYRQQPDRTRVGAQLAQVGEERRRVEEGRQEYQQYQLGVQLDLGQARQEAEDQPSEREQDRVGHLHHAGDHGQRGGCSEESEEEKLEVLH
jgi:hypothetical protein